MQLVKIATLRADTGVAGAPVSYPLAISSGGRAAKVVQYMVKVVGFNGGPQLQWLIGHGPDGIVHDLHTSSGAAQSIPVSRLFVFDSDATKILGEYLHPIAVVSGGSTGDGMTIEVYELRKPF